MPLDQQPLVYPISRTTLRIISLKIKWPLVVTCAIDYINIDINGIQLFNMENHTCIRHIVTNASDISIIGNILFICGIHSDRFETRLGHQFWDLNQLTDISVKNEDISSRKIEAYANLQHLQNSQEICASAIIGNRVLTIEGQSVVQRSFWP